MSPAESPIPPTLLPDFDNQGRPSLRFSQICALATATLALMAGLGWLLHLRSMAGEWSTHIPMAPLSAISFLLLSAALFSLARWPGNLVVRRWGQAAVITTAWTGLWVVGHDLVYASPVIESWLFGDAQLRGIPLGRMSPATGLMLVMESLALGLLLRYRRGATTAALLALGATILGMVFLAGYAYGVPFFYDVRIIPMALPTALAFIFAGAGIFGIALSQSPFLRPWNGSNLRGRLLWAFLPAMLLVMFVEGWTDVVFENYSGMNPAVWHSLTALAASALIIFIVGWIARHTGDAVELAQDQIKKVARFSDESPSPVLRFTRQGQLLYANRSSRHLLDHWNCLTPGQGLPPVEQQWIAEALQSGTHQEHEIHLDAHVFALMFTPIPEMGYVNVYGRDITQHKQAEAVLRRKTALLEAQLNASLDGILVVDEHDRRILSNRRLVELFKIPQSVMEDEDDSKMLSHVTSMIRNPVAFLERVRYLYEHSNEISQDEIEFQNGTILDRYSSPVLGPDGSNYGRIWAFRDITARKEAEAADRRRQVLEESVASMEQVLGIVAHELRTPLAGMRAISELLLDHDLRATAEFDAFLGNINHEAIRMSETVETLLEAARINSGRVQWNWDTVDLQAACDAALAAVRPLVDADRIDLRHQVIPAGARMNGDAHAIQRLIINLVSNAQKFTKNGHITVTARQHLQESTPWVELSVEDTGAGISPAIAQRLGEAFALSSGIVGANHIKGTGLGLAICKAIVAAHGGAIVVRSAVGSGTTITARLRADLPAAARDQVRVEFIGIHPPQEVST